MNSQPTHDHRICILIPYFGSWPRWTHVFLETCRWNPSIDWCLLSDASPSQDLPPNVRVVSTTLADVAALAERQLECAVSLSRAFKLCDFKPAYGVIFADYVRDYDFWAWGDVDVVYGNMRRFLTRRVLDYYDFVSARNWYLTGELTLVRNTEHVNQLFRSSPHAQMVFGSERLWCFDEYAFFTDRSVDSMTHVVKRSARRGLIKVRMKDNIRTDRQSLSRDLRLFWKNGELVDENNGEALLLYHFLDRKKQPVFEFPPAPVDFSHGFHVSSSGVTRAAEHYEPANRPVRAALRQCGTSIRRARAWFNDTWHYLRNGDAAPPFIPPPVNMTSSAEINTR